MLIVIWLYSEHWIATRTARLIMPFRIGVMIVTVGPVCVLLLNAGYCTVSQQADMYDRSLS